MSTARRALAVIGGALALLIFLAIDFGPNVPTPPPADPRRAEQARALLEGIQASMAVPTRPARVEIGSAQLESASVLAGRMAWLGRFDASVQDGALVVRGSRRLVGPLWLNLKARVPESDGFPDIRLTLGDLPLGKRLSRFVIERVAARMRARLPLPPLDTAVRSVRIAPDRVIAAVDFPLDRVIAGVPWLRHAPVDAQAAIRFYCALVLADRRAPPTDMAEVVRRAFAGPGGDVEANRARFLAIAMYATSPGDYGLTPGQQAGATGCGSPSRAPLLGGRADLAKHWAVSAVITAAGGDDLAHAIGEWKELSDTRPKGSGFSFVDLAADRAGVAAARRATDPATAADTAQRLAQVRGEALLPLRALALAEGLTEAQFVARYRNVDSRRYRDAVARVDRVIARTVGD